MNPQYTKVYTLQSDLFTQQCTVITSSYFEQTCSIYLVCYTIIKDMSSNRAYKLKQINDLFRCHYIYCLPNSSWNSMLSLSYTSLQAFCL